MFKNIFQQDSQVSFRPLHDELSSQAKMRSVVRRWIGKPLQQILCEGPRTLHTLSLSRFSVKTKVPDAPRNVQTGKVVTNLKRLKSLRCLNIDLSWLLMMMNKDCTQFAESLKHLKDLSVIHFYVTEKASLSQIPRLYQNLCKIPALPKVEVRLSVLFYVGMVKEDLDELLRALSLFGRLTSVHLTCDFASSLGLVEFFGYFENIQSLTRGAITIDVGYLSAYEKFPDVLLECLKRIKSLKDSKITLGLSTLSLKDLETLKPKLKEAVQLFNLDITFQVRSNLLENLTISQWKRFVESIQKDESPYKFCAHYIGKLVNPFTAQGMVSLAMDEKYFPWNLIVFILLLLVSMLPTFLLIRERMNSS